jgi:hypothetical protein
MVIMKTATWIYLATAGFLVSVILSILFIYHGRDILGSDKAILYYILLFPMGISSAVFLFRVLKSVGNFRGTYAGGKLMLGGPVVIFGLIFVGGFYYYRNPPAPDQYNFAILIKDSSDLPKILQGSATLGYESASLQLYEIKDGRINFSNGIPGNTIDIQPQIPGYFLKHPSHYKIPYPPDPLEVFVYEDTITIGHIRKLYGAMSTILNAYLNNAKDFKDFLSDTDYYIGLVKPAFDSLCLTISRYNNSFHNLFIIKDSLVKENHKYLIVDTNILVNALADFTKIHQNFFKDFDLNVRPMLIDLYQTGNKKDRSAICARIRQEISNTELDMKDLDEKVSNIQKTLSF